jgi:uncharacterized membrane protein
LLPASRLPIQLVLASVANQPRPGLKRKPELSGVRLKIRGCLTIPGTNTWRAGSGAPRLLFSGYPPKFPYDTRMLEDFGTGKGFRCRGKEVNRIEGFSDAVFGFALTLLVISLEVPRTFRELKVAMQGFPAFAICFAWLLSIWFQHYRFFRRYGLQDATTFALNAILLFVVLFYVYPLKFLFSLLTSGIWKGGGRVGAEHPQPITGADVPTLMIIYGLGFIAVYLVIALLNWHAYRLRDRLQLSESEEVLTIGAIRVHLLSAMIGVTSILIVIVGGREHVALAGWIYFSVSLVHALNGWRVGVKIRQLTKRTARQSASQQPAA